MAESETKKKTTNRGAFPESKRTTMKRGGFGHPRRVTKTTRGRCLRPKVPKSMFVYTTEVLAHRNGIKNQQKVTDGAILASAEQALPFISRVYNATQDLSALVGKASPSVRTVFAAMLACGELNPTSVSDLLAEIAEVMPIPSQ